MSLVKYFKDNLPVICLVLSLVANILMEDTWYSILNSTADTMLMIFLMT